MPPPQRIRATRDCAAGCTCRGCKRSCLNGLASSVEDYALELRAPVVNGSSIVRVACAHSPHWSIHAVQCVRTFTRQHSKGANAGASRWQTGGTSHAGEKIMAVGAKPTAILALLSLTPAKQVLGSRRYSMFTMMSTANSLRRTRSGATLPSISPASSPAKAEATRAKFSRAASSPRKTVKA